MCMSVLHPPWQLRQTLFRTFVSLTLLPPPRSARRRALNFEAYQNLPRLAIDYGTRGFDPEVRGTPSCYGAGRLIASQ